MPTELEIREAITEVIKTAVGAGPIVIGRDILDVFNTGWMSVLRDADGFIRGWTVTQNGALPSEERGYGAGYDLYFDVWQWRQYQTGTNAQNSEDSMSAERELVMLAFSKPKEAPVNLHAALDDVKPLEFPPGSIATVESDFRGQVRVAKGVLRVGKIFGC